MRGLLQIFRSSSFKFILALVVALFAVFTIIGTCSYLSTWQEDASTIAAPAGASSQVSNQAGSMGYLWGRFLVCRTFGLGSFTVSIFLVLVTLKLFRGLKASWLKLTLFLLLGTLLLSVILGFVAQVLPGDEMTAAFGGGLGGECGAFLAAAMMSFMGPWVTAVLLLFMLLVITFLLSSRFENAVVRIMERSPRENTAEGEMDADGEKAGTEEEEDVEEIGAEAPGGDFQPAIADSPECEDLDPEPPHVEGNPAGQKVPEPAVVISGPEDELSTDVDSPLPRLDIRSDVDRYSFPPLDLLEDYSNRRYSIPAEEINGNIEKIKSTLSSFHIPVTGISASVGYTVTLYRIVLGEGVRVNTIKNLEDDIAIKIGIKGVRVVMLSDAVGIEVPNQKPSTVPLKAILNSDAFRNSKGELPIALGYTITTKAKVFDLADAPHLLVAGATKQGKSVGLNAIISSLLYAKHPTELKFVFIDPKMVEFQKYSKLIKHYLALLSTLESSEEESKAIVKDPKTAETVLRSLCVEMDERYALLSKAGVNKITDYNEKYSNRRLRPDDGHHFMPYLVVVVDEYADLTKSGNDRNLSRSIENSINRLAAKGRAAGLHVIIATQRPSVDVITGTIKGNFPTRMAFRTAQRQDSQTILGMAGAEKLIGKGDMLFFTGADAERVQCALVESDEIEKLTKYISQQTGYRQSCSEPYYLPDPGEADGTASSGSGENGGLIDMKNLDSMFKEAAEMVVMNGSMSTTMLQRKLQLGFARAGRIMDQLEAAGIVGPSQGSRPREALVSDLASLQSILDAYMK